ncbi:MAG: FecR domain-containing protein [Sandaracinus sp.]
MSERIESSARAAREHVTPAWDDLRAVHLAERARARARRRQLARGGVAALAIAAAATVALVITRPATGGSTHVDVDGHPDGAIAAPGDADGVLRFPEGSSVTPLSGETEVLVEAVRDGAIELDLARGAARFDVTPGLPRAFRVQAGLTTVSVVGTRFVVRREGDGAVVEVQEGRVHVTWSPDGDAYVAAGERGVFPRAMPLVATATATTAAPGALGTESVELAPPVSTTEPSPSARAEPPRPHRPEHAPAAPQPEGLAAAPPEETPAPEIAPPSPTRPAWRALADEGRFDDGYAMLLADRTALASDDVESLMAAADCARLSGHPGEALAYLHRASEVGAHDARAPMVAFTLGRVLLAQLDRPREAADEFARARALSPSGSLASDALAREVEAWSRASEPVRARERAEEYLRLYPEGVRAAAVRRLGGLE